MIKLKLGFWKQRKREKKVIREKHSLYTKIFLRGDPTIFLKKEKIEIQVGPESLYQAAILRESRGDWQKAFEHLKLIAEAYTDYDFERVAESLMRIAERLAKEKLPKNGVFFPVLDRVLRIDCV